MNQKTSIIKIVILTLISHLLLSSCQNTPLNKNKTLRLAHGLDINHPVHRGMEYMSNRVNEISAGQLQVKIYPSEQLGTERQCLEMLQIGSLDMTKVSAAVMEGFVPKYKALGLPYLFRNKEHAYAVLDSEIGQEILLAGTPFWLRGMAFYDAGSRSFYTLDQPIEKPEDLNGMKIRVMKSITSVKTIKALGGSPTPIAWGELYTSLQNGVVDGAENNPPTFHLSHHYEVCKYYSLDEHSVIPDVLLMSTHTWEALTEQEQKWITQATWESLKIQREYWQEAEKEALETVKKAGIKIIRPDKALFRKAVKPVYEYFKVRNPEVHALGEKIRNFKTEKSE